MAQHGGNSIVPLKFKALSQLICLFWRRLTPAPHLRPHGFHGSIRRYKILIDNLLKAQPGQVPAAIALRITAYPRLRVGHDVPTERVVPRESSQFSEELVAADVVAPCLRHWSLESYSITLVTCRCYPLNSHELGESVDGVRLE